jgi:hypothetical protein
MVGWRIGAAGAALAAALAGAPVAAQDGRVFTLKQLYEICRAGDASRQSACSGFVTGVRHTLDVFKNSLKDRLTVCIPATVDNRAFRDNFLAWAEKNPGEFGRSAVRGVIKSAFERYPCTRGPGKPFEF